MDSGGSGAGDTSSETPNVVTSAEKVAAGDTSQQQADPDDFDAVPAEVTDSLGRKKANAIPHPRVKTMIGKATQKQLGALAKELGITKAEAELVLDDVLGAVREKNTKFTEHEQFVTGLRDIEDEMQNRPDEFIKRAARIHPGYKKFADLLEQAQAAATQTATTDDPEPEPDYPIKDAAGNVIGHTYSVEGMKKARAWDRRQATREAEQHIGDRLKPIEDRFKTEADQENARRIQKDIDVKLTTQLDKAKKWPGFEEHAPEILKVLQTDKTASLHDAYMQVVPAKLAADRQKMREELLAEQNALPRSTSVAATASAPKSDGPRDTASIAREVMRELGA